MSKKDRLTWVLITDTNSARIYQRSGSRSKLERVKEFSHPENRLKDSEFCSDRLGRYKGNDVGHGAFSPDSDPKEVKIDQFAAELADSLNQGRNNNAFEALIVVAPPRMNGLLFKHLNKHVVDLVEHRIEKDWVRCPDSELELLLSQQQSS